MRVDATLGELLDQPLGLVQRQELSDAHTYEGGLLLSDDSNRCKSTNSGGEMPIQLSPTEIKGSFLLCASCDRPNYTLQAQHWGDAREEEHVCACVWGNLQGL